MPGGRPTKYTKALETAVCKRIMRNCTVSAACAAEGIDRDTWQRWRDPDSTYFNEEFYVNTTRALASNECDMAGVLFDGAKGQATDTQVRASTEVLKRRYRHDWSDSLNLTSLTPEQLAALAGIK